VPARRAQPPATVFRRPNRNCFVALQQQWLNSQHQLWQAFAQRKPDDGRAPRWSGWIRRTAASVRRMVVSPYFDYLRQAYVLNAAFMRECVEATPVADGRAKDRMRYLSKQMIEAMSPANFAATNPEFIQTALRYRG
jgi:polyhydroxyalkanoate synthase